MAIASYKQEFIEFMIRASALKFGDFVTKSGRQTPFFINSGSYNDGARIKRLGEFYAHALMAELNGEFDNLFGPAYKGIPLVTTTSAALHADFAKSVTYTFNRKEAKDHGEKGVMVGHQYRGDERVVIVEDVVTAGTSVYESVPLLQEGKAVFHALVVSVDRQERGKGESSALQQIASEFGVRAFAIVTLDDIVSHLHNREIDGQVWLDDAMYERIAAYRQQYGVSDA